MSDVLVLNALKTFLEKNVTSQIKLQNSNDDNALAYDLVNPAVHIGWIPPKGFIPEQMEVTIPCIIVGFDDADDDGIEAGMNIRLSFAVFSPGKHEIFEGEEKKFTPDFHGYVDLLNFIEKTKQALLRNRIINGVTTIEPTLKWGMYQDQPYPYWYGWLTFRARLSSGQYVESISQQFL